MDQAQLQALLEAFKQNSRDNAVALAPPRFALLDNSNYMDWKKDCEQYLRKIRLWDVVSTEVVGDLPRKQDAYSTIYENCSQSAKTIIYDISDPYEAWVSLEKHYAAKSRSNKARLLAEFTSLTKPSDQPVEKFILAVMQAGRNLDAVGEKQSDTALVNKLISGLGPEYTMLKVSLSTQNDLSKDDVCQAILQEERRIKQEKDAKISAKKDSNSRDTREEKRENRNRSRSPRPRSNAYQGTNNRRFIRCDHCGKPGHIMNQCFQLHPQLRPNYATGANAYRPSTNYYQPVIVPPQQASYVHQFPHNPFPQYNIPPEWLTQQPHSASISQMQTPQHAVSNQHTNQHTPSQSQHRQSQRFHSASVAMMVPEHAILQALQIYSDYKSPPSEKIYDYFDFAMLTMSGYINPVQNLWVVDSGASNHFVSSRAGLRNYVDITPCVIRTGKGLIFRVGMGTLDLVFNINGLNVTRSLEDVIFAPELQGGVNLFSLPQMTQKGCSFFFDSTKCTVVRENKIVATASLVNKAYYLDIVHPNPIPVPPQMLHHHSAFLGGSTDRQPIDHWHLRLGHLGQDNIRKLSAMSTGMEFGTGKTLTITQDCPSCRNASQTRQVSRNASHSARVPLEIIHCDIIGPFLIPSLNGLRFASNFLDEVTRFNRGYLYSKKSEFFNSLRTFVARAECETNRRVQNLHMDGAGENLSDEVRAYCQMKGIAIMITQSYSPEMNGLAEPYNRTILIRLTSMLDYSDLPDIFWSEAYDTAVYLLNRQPHDALEVTPFEAYYGRKPNLGHLKVFGCRAYAHVPEELRQKMNWDLRSTECVFIGYTQTENLYKLWDIKKGVIIYKRDVIFDETKLGHESLGSRTVPSMTTVVPLIHALIDSHQLNELPQSSDVHNFLLLPDRGGTQSVSQIPRTRASSVPLANVVFENYVPPVQGEDRRPIKKVKKASLSSPVNDASSPSLSPPRSEPRFTTFEEWQVPVSDSRVELPITAPLNFLPPLTQSGISSKEQSFLSVIHGLLADISQDECTVRRWEDMEEHQAFTVVDACQVTVEIPPLLDEYPLALRDAAHLLPKIPKTYKGAIDGPFSKQWKEAMDLEMEALMFNDTWQLVELPDDAVAVPCKWVYAVKRDEFDKVRKFKARLVARGDLQREGIDHDETFAPVVKFVSVKLILAIATLFDYEAPHFDIVSAFLNGDIDGVVYMRQPPGYVDFSDLDISGKPKVCLLNKALYGLCQAARRFYFKMDAVMLMVGYTRYSADWALWIHDSGLYVLGIHVDDILSAMTRVESLRVKEHLEIHFRVTDLGDVTCYLSMYIVRDRVNKTTKIHQTPYIRKVLINEGLDDSHPVSTPMVVGENWERDSVLLPPDGKKIFQRIIGCLLYIMHGTRPDIAYATIKLSQYSAAPKEIHMVGVKRILRYLKGTIDVGILFKGDDKAWNSADLEFYFDAAHADTKLMRSTCGFIGFFRGCPITWTSKVQKTIALSTTEAEYMAGTEAAKEVLWLKGLTDSISKLTNIKWPIVLYGDNQSSLALVRNPEFHQRSKHIEIRHRFISELYQRGIIVVEHVKSGDQLADFLTKPLPKDIHHKHCGQIGLDMPNSPSSALDSVADQLIQDVISSTPVVPTDRSTPDFTHTAKPDVSTTAQHSRQNKIRCSVCSNLFKDIDALLKHRMTGCPRKD